MTKKEQIIHFIKEHIQKNNLVHGDKLLSESEISKLFRVSRSTVRTSLTILEANNIIYRLHGQGTFVNKEPEISIRSGIGFTSEAKKQGYTSSTKSVILKKVKADDEISAKLDIPINESVWKIHRTRCLDNIVVMYSIEYFPHKLMPHLTKEIAYSSIYDWLEYQNLATYSYADQEITSILSDELLSTHLEVPVGSPLMEVKLVAYTNKGTPFNCGCAYYKSSNFKISMRVHKPE